MPASLITVNRGTAPAGYTLAPGETLDLESATAHFDGAAAAGAFLPAIAIYAPTGELLGRTFPRESVAVGGTADVTFAPF